MQMKRKIFLIAVAILLAVQSFGQAKYVFYFIGDGMGVNQVNLTELYLGAQKGQFGTEKLLFPSFPSGGVATTWCHDNEVTDSAAAGTALATGSKTDRANVGTDPDNNPLTNVAEMAKRSGKKVAILTTVGINDATPAAFYGHQPTRYMSDELIKDMAAADVDFYAGAGFQRNDGKKYPKCVDDPYALFSEAGFTIAGSVGDFDAKYASATKMLMMPDKDHHVYYDIDRDGGSEKYITLKDMVESSIKFLTKDKKNNGFFIMAEGGAIDHACHGNDAATVVKEVIDFDAAIHVAYEFYLKHQKETAIIVTADHETGGITLNLGKYEKLAKLSLQKSSEGRITDRLKAQMKQKGKEPLTWDEIKAFFAENLGLWKEVRLSPEDELSMFEIYTRTIAQNVAGNKDDEYGYNHDASIVSAAIDLFDRIAGVRWSSTGHTAGYVPVYAVGVGQEKFTGRIDNTDIPKKVIEIGRYK